MVFILCLRVINSICTSFGQIREAPKWILRLSITIGTTTSVGLRLCEGITIRRQSVTSSVRILAILKRLSIMILHAIWEFKHGGRAWRTMDKILFLLFWAAFTLLVSIFVVMIKDLLLFSLYVLSFRLYPFSSFFLWLSCHTIIVTYLLFKKSLRLQRSCSWRVLLCPILIILRITVRGIWAAWLHLGEFSWL